MVAVISPRFSLHNTLIIWAAKNCSYFSALGQPHKSECFPKLLSILYRSYILLFPIYAIVQQLLSAIASTISQKHFYILIPSTFGRCLPRSTPSVPPKPTTCFTPIPENHVWIISDDKQLSVSSTTFTIPAARTNSTKPLRRLPVL